MVAGRNIGSDNNRGACPRGMDPGGGLVAGMMSPAGGTGLTCTDDVAAKSGRVVSAGGINSLHHSFADGI